MKWAQEQRLLFVGRLLRNSGYVNRADIMDVFRISKAQAAKDFAAFMRLHPKAMIYNETAKRYEAADPETGQVARLKRRS